MSTTDRRARSSTDNAPDEIHSVAGHSVELPGRGIDSRATREDRR